MELSPSSHAACETFDQWFFDEHPRRMISNILITNHSAGISLNNRQSVILSIVPTQNIQSESYNHHENSLFSYCHVIFITVLTFELLYKAYLILLAYASGNHQLTSPVFVFEGTHLIHSLNN